MHGRWQLGQRPLSNCYFSLYKSDFFPRFETGDYCSLFPKAAFGGDRGKKAHVELSGCTDGAAGGGRRRSAADGLAPDTAYPSNSLTH